MMTINNFAFTPTEGLRNVVSFPTTPASEADARDQVQDISDQIRDYINNTIITELNNRLPLSGGDLTGDLSTSGKVTATGTLTGSSLIVNGSTGAAAASRYMGATTSGAPTAGIFAKGDYVIDQAGGVWICTVAGTPGTWKSAAGSILIPEMYIPLWFNGQGAVTATSTTSGTNFLGKAAGATPSTSTASESKLHTLNANWPASTKFALEIALKCQSTNTAFAQLWDFTAGAVVTGTQVSLAANNITIIRSAQVNLTPGRQYGVTIWSNSGSSAYATDASLIAFPS